ncbi:aspartyl/asparaginyl beta-hydroxylase domain-containing protein [Pseudomonas typographi]|uniref:Aspartyl/asparaginyl beta-hydroxylase domain-containing protein n=1 Tax=Pseudomonas typographi TaxID=2715964 RepID=A0ABR7Z6V2_9PSED|nr:aspartyl/asparaginyl beta-hydroxylase domain-containing protein [Pseudomonas typographi]MBD1555159.1 aspartyl/asparaginyl beta-hydroxylase domain-containing protein [Pseudomonas typographi]MBD1589614.1 aspartyl/asparaginyl beta-hydroxylase domain-containing protein [Pseudomonas typographi]MBD1601127.1 aspartyl/asparaginyl beta-hydroxylase domain-containing protein [Pseudomonas typographi]
MDKCSAAPPKPKRKHRPSVAAGLWVIKRLENFIRRHSTVGTTPFFDPQKIPGIQVLQEQWPTLLQELNAVLKRSSSIPNFQDISKDQQRLTQDDRWKTYFLYGYGYKMDGNCAACPETTRIVESIPGMTTAFFSILSPGKHIPPHRGPYNGLLRVHLGLIIPEPQEQCRIQVGEETRHWQLGECLVFDDTYRHQVWNDTDGMRVVLFLDIERPLDRPGRLLNRVVLKLIQLSPFIQDARKNHRAWEQRAFDDQ